MDPKSQTGTRPKRALYPRIYKGLVGKLNYLILTRHDIAFAVSEASHFLSSPCQNVVVQTLIYIKNVLSKLPHLQR